jgi:hypothetical protein
MYVYVSNYSKMVYDNIQPSQFVMGQPVEVVFLEDDKPKWYKGLVQSVDHSGEDNNGTYVECKVEYEDGEVVDDARFYDCDFENDESLDSWRFASSLNDVLEALDEVKGDIEFLRKQSERRPPIPLFVKLAFFIATGALMKAAYMYCQEESERSCRICELTALFQNAMTGNMTPSK